MMMLLLVVFVWELGRIQSTKSASFLVCKMVQFFLKFKEKDLFCMARPSLINPYENTGWNVILKFANILQSCIIRKEGRKITSKISFL